MATDPIPPNSELGYLQELIDVFGVEGGPDARTAQDKIRSRYLTVGQTYENISQKYGRDGKGDVIPDLDTVLHQIALTLHDYLYQGILSNAGRYRKATDPGGGTIFFGGKQPGRRRMKFEGSPPADIKDDLRHAFRVLSNGSLDPKAASIEFYMRFNRVHPFYDANGRISRLIVSIYLHLYGTYVDWDRVDRAHGDFVSRMNSCHKRAKGAPNQTHYEPEQYNEYFGYVLSYWEKCLSPISDFHGS